MSTPTLEELQKAHTDALAKVDSLTKEVDSLKQANNNVAELQAKLTELAEANKRLSAIVNTMTQQPPKNDNKDDDMPDPAVDPKGFAAWQDRKFEEKLRRQREAEDDNRRKATEMAAESQKVKARFYAAHPHLVGHEILVAAFTEEVIRENPYISEADGFKKIAEKTVEYIQKLKGGTPAAPAAPHVMDPQNPHQPPKAPELPETYDPTGNTSEAVKEMKKKQAGGMGQDPYKK